jgi:hypothetical protein
MKMLVTLLVAITPVIAQADKNFSRGKGGGWDCSKDPIVNINHGKGIYKLTGPCRLVAVNSSQNKVTIEDVDTLLITGGTNIVTVHSLGEVRVNGTANKITYKASKSDKVTSDLQGENNSLEQTR